MQPATMPGYRTKGQLAYEHLRNLIIESSLKPGERLVIDQLATQLGVSKVPIREAVDRLIGEGWLARSPHIGPFVPLLTPQEVREIAILRAALEGETIRYATPLHTTQSLDVAQEFLVKMSAMDGNVSDLNVEFHTALMAPCPYDQIKSAALDYLRRAARFHTVVRLGNNAELTFSAHEDLLAVVRAGDADKASSMTREHILSAAARLEARLLRQED